MDTERLGIVAKRVDGEEAEHDRGRRHPEQDDRRGATRFRPQPVAGDPDEQEDDERAGAPDRGNGGEIGDVGKDEREDRAGRSGHRACRERGPSRGGTARSPPARRSGPAAPKSVPFVAPAVAISAAIAISVKPASPSVGRAASAIAVSPYPIASSTVSVPKTPIEIST